MDADLRCLGKWQSQSQSQSMEATMGLSSRLNPLSPPAKIFVQEEPQLRRNVLFVSSDEAWEQFMSTSHRQCGAFVFFKRNFCPSCAHVAPKVYEASYAQTTREIAFVDVDVDKCPRTVRRLEIDMVPSFQVYSHGKLKWGFTGVSIGELKSHIQRSLFAAAACRKCGDEVRVAFWDLEHVILPGVQRILQCTADCGTACVEAYNSMPDGLQPLSFDSEYRAPIRSRIVELQRRLQELPAPTDRISEYACQFLAEVTDEELNASDIWRVVHRWLTTQDGHASLWPSGHQQLRQRLANAALARRAHRAELWLLSNLSQEQYPSRLQMRLSNEIREKLSEQVNELRNGSRACLASCMRCSSNCCVGPHGHDGPHDCLTDHCCHRTPPGGTVIGGSRHCLREAGHSGSCLFRQPNTPLRQQQGIEVSVADILAPLSALIPLDVKGTSDSTTCAICLDSLISGGTCVALPCAHSFHRVCCVEWLIRKPFCPLCRYKVVASAEPTSDSPRALPTGQRTLPHLLGLSDPPGNLLGRLPVPPTHASSTLNMSGTEPHDEPVEAQPTHAAEVALQAPTDRINENENSSQDLDGYEPGSGSTVLPSANGSGSSSSSSSNSRGVFRLAPIVNDADEMLFANNPIDDGPALAHRTGAGVLQGLPRSAGASARPSSQTDRNSGMPCLGQGPDLATRQGPASGGSMRSTLPGPTAGPPGASSGLTFNHQNQQMRLRSSVLGSLQRGRRAQQVRSLPSIARSNESQAIPQGNSRRKRAIV